MIHQRVDRFFHGFDPLDYCSDGICRNVLPVSLSIARQQHSNTGCGHTEGVFHMNILEHHFPVGCTGCDQNIRCLAHDSHSGSCHQGDALRLCLQSVVLLIGVRGNGSAEHRHCLCSCQGCPRCKRSVSHAGNDPSVCDGFHIMYRPPADLSVVFE